MKFFAFSCRDFDEKMYFEKYAEEFGLEFEFTAEGPTMENLHLAEGSAFISILTTPIDAPMLDALKEMGVGMVSTRTIGYDHIDIAHAEEIGMIVTHITYDPEGVADYCVMMILATLRNLGRILENNKRNDFTLRGLLGRKLADCTVGIIGAGNIGISVLRDLSGFGCRLVYCNRSAKPEADMYAERVSMDELLAMSDIVSLHLEYNSETAHIIDDDAFSKMKDGVVFINTARGPLVDSDALIRALESGKVGAAGLDVIEGEFDMCYFDRSAEEYRNRVLDPLRSFPNVLHTHHMGFYYETAIRDMVYNCILGMRKCMDGEEIPYRLV